jgi:hypothetical protein
MTEPRVLVISNTALKTTNANGQVLLGVLSQIPVENRASFFIQNTIPEKSTSKTAFRITDTERLHSYFNGKAQGTVLDPAQEATETKDVQTGHGKESFFRHLVRDRVWNHGKWDPSLLYHWILEFRPTVILFMSGRSPFMFNLVYDISLHFGLPVVIYTGEDEYWHKPKFLNLWDAILRHKLHKATKRLNQRVRHYIVSNDKIAQLFKDTFHLPVTAIMPSTEAQPVSKINSKGFLFYGGNLKPGRYQSLKDISLALSKIAPEKMIDVYSNDIDDKIRRCLAPLKNVVLHDAVPRKELNEARSKAFLLLHFESFSSKIRPMIQNAFSTKIPDCLGSGIPFLVYAPKYCGFSTYLSAHPEAVAYASNLIDLNLLLKQAIFDEKYRAGLVSNSLVLVKENHDSIRNGLIQKQILSEAKL